jgi:hypothetical protein
MRKIYKYPIALKECQTVDLTKGARVLTAQLQNGEIVMWAEVDPDEPMRVWLVYTVGTGTSFIADEHPGEYVATVQRGEFVWHLYARPASGSAL